MATIRAISFDASAFLGSFCQGGGRGAIPRQPSQGPAVRSSRKVGEKSYQNDPAGQTANLTAILWNVCLSSDMPFANSFNFHHPGPRVANLVGREHTFRNIL